MPFQTFPFLAPHHFAQISRRGVGARSPHLAAWTAGGCRVTGLTVTMGRNEPMNYSLSEAAKATGKSKMTIQRAIKSHVISATRNDDGSYAIDPAELHRVFRPVTNDTGLIQSEPPPDPAALQREIGVLRESLADKEGTIKDLRQRLDQEGEDRRKAHAQLAALLTDQRVQADREAQEAPPTRGSSWWVVGGLALAIVAVVTWWVQNHPRIPS